MSEPRMSVVDAAREMDGDPRAFALPTTEAQAPAAPAPRRVLPPGVKTLQEIIDSDTADLTSLPLLGRDGFFTEGWSHVMASAPRTGKTELFAHGMVAWLRQGRRVHLLTEESEAIWKDRGEALNALYGAGLWEGALVTQTMGRDPSELLGLASDMGAEIVIADTLRHVAGMRDENDAAEARRAVAPWIDQCQRLGQTFIAGAHLRKSAGAAGGERIGGSVAIVALFDVILELEEDPPNRRRRRLSGRSRRREVPSVTTEMLEGEGMVILGDTRSVSRVDGERRCAEVVRAAGEAMTTKEVWLALGRDAPTLETVLRWLTSAAKRQEVRRVPGLGEPSERVTLRWTTPDLFNGATP